MNKLSSFFSRHRQLPLFALCAFALFYAFAHPLLAQERKTSDQQFENLPERGRDSAFVPLMQYIEVDEQESWRHADLNSASTLLGTLTRAGTLGSNNCTEQVLKSAQLSLLLDMGEDYIYGNNTFTVQLTLQVLGKNSMGSTVLSHNPVNLTAVESGPEQLFRVKYSGTDLQNYEGVDYFEIHVTSYTSATLVQDSIRLTASFHEEHGIGAIDTTSPATPLVAPEPMPGIIRGNPITFEWNQRGTCSDSLVNYQFQLLRLHNMNEAYDDEMEAEAPVDWSQALTIETGNGKRNLDLTVAEGTGWYAWRVRPIGSVYDGAITDDRNWGAWSPSPPTGDVLDLTDPGFTRSTAEDSALFFYQQFDADINYVYGRIFSEGSDGTRTSEGVTYATPALRPAQSQARIKAQDSIIVSNGASDFVGRPVVSALPVPEEYGTIPFTGEDAYFGYLEDMTENDGERFDEADFDADSTFADPGQRREGEGVLVG